MSKKRISPKSSTDEQTNEASDSFQQDDNAKRVKLASFSDTTLQDLPIELIECILIKAVTLEVKGMKLAKSVWKEKADLVISRLKTVCSQWSSILTTNFFRNQVNGILDGIAQETIRLEILHQSPLPIYVYSITTMKDEIFMLGTPQDEDAAINVYDRNNMAEMKDVIPLPGLRPHSIAACSVSNCVYLLSRVYYYQFSLRRIARDDEHRYSVSLVNSKLYLPFPTMRVTANGCLLFSRLPFKQHAPVIVCDANGSMLHVVKLSPGISSFCNIVPKSNGNLVFVSGTQLTEVDVNGILIRQYQSSLNVDKSISHVDNYGRMLLVDRYKGMELIDSEFNLVDSTGHLLGGGQFSSSCEFHYNSERNEILTIVDPTGQNRILTIFHLTEI